MSTKAGWREIDAKSNQALTRVYVRTGWQPTSADMPFDRILDVPLTGDGSDGGAALKALEGNGSFLDLVAAADDGSGEGEVGQYEIRQRMVGVRTFFAFLKARAVTPMDFFRQLAAAGRAMHEEPFSLMTMDEVGMMEGQSKAAHSWRCKIMSGEIELHGMKGSKLPGQKSKAASESYREQRKGNNNRKGGKKASAKAARQQSFLRKLKVKPTPTSDQ